MDVRFDMSDVQALARRLNASAQQITLATTRGINKTAAKTLTAANKAIRQQVALPAAYVKSKLTLRKATVQRPEATLSAAKRGVLLSRFKHSATKKGVRVTVKPGQSKLIVGAFLMRLRAGTTDGAGALGIAARAKAGNGRVPRYPVEVFHGPSVSQVYNDTRQQLKPDIEADLPQQIAGELRYLLLRRRT